MSEQPLSCDEALSALFGALGSSLLQYLDEAEPWTDGRQRAARASLDELAGSQRQSIDELADLVARRHVLPESFSFPSQFAGLHYLSLDFLMDWLLADQIGVVAAADAALAACRADQAVADLEKIRSREAGHFDRLRQIAESLRPSGNSGRGIA